MTADRIIQGFILALHGIALLVSLLLLSSKWRPFAFALVFDSLTGALFYAALLFFDLRSGHELSRLRALIQATIWAFFGVGIYLNQRKDK